MIETENSKKLEIKKKQYVTAKELEQLKQSLNQIEPKEIINDALDLANKQLLENNKEKNEVLAQNEKKAIDSFLFEINNTNKKIDQLRLISNQKLEDFKISTNLIEEKTQKESKEYTSQLEGIKRENQMLRKKYSDLKNQFDDIQKKHNNNLSHIEQMKQNEKIFLLNKPVFNEFLKQFKDKTPLQMIQDIEKQKDGF